MSQRRHRRSQTCWQLGVHDSKGPARALQGLLQREAITRPPRQRCSSWVVAGSEWIEARTVNAAGQQKVTPRAQLSMCATHTKCDAKTRGAVMVFGNH